MKPQIILSVLPEALQKVAVSFYIDFTNDYARKSAQEIHWQTTNEYRHNFHMGVDQIFHHFFF